MRRPSFLPTAYASPQVDWESIGLFTERSPRSGGGQADQMCAICFEDLSEVGGAITLPCSCQMSYCGGCWDHALCVSYRTTQTASCPSCRCAVRVDFDAEQARLVFSMQTQASDLELINRLADQVLPFSISVLEQNRAAISAAPRATQACVQMTGRIGEIATSDVADSELSYKLRFHDGQEPTVDWFARAAVEEVSDIKTLRCVCGGCLKQVCSPKPSTVKCDLCARRIRSRKQHWTCANNKSRLLHPNGYDVCTACMNSA